MRTRFGPLLAVLVFVILLPGTVSAQASADWDQHVRYDIDVTLLADRHLMHGTQQLAYTNNSKDTLRQVFYHLYFNAFQPNSMMAERNRQLPDPDSRVVPRIFELGPDEIGYHEVLSLTQDGAPVGFDVTDTVLRVELAEPILPGETTVFEMQFRSQVPLQTRRSGRDNLEGIDYSMTQWYPKMAMYDERGWHADPYVGREFYAPFGSFDVAITLPSDHVIGATGVLQNPQDIGHGYGGTDAGPATDADSLTWHFQADQVHDFAWSADPDYLHDEVRGPMGITYHLVYQPDVAERWQYMTNWTPGIIQFFSQQYGRYPYPQMTVAQGGDGGMEYPMITLITGRRSPASLFGVTAHELAHMWFYGVVGTNEADYAWLDEGFASYAGTESRRLVYDVEDPSHMGSYLSVLNLHDLGLFERLNTPSDWFATNTAYSAAYSAGAMFIEMMGYVIGEEQRLAWIREYYDRFQFRHPNPYDLEKVAEDVSGLRLDWYFEQFTNTTRQLDYGIEDVDSERSGDGYRTTILMERKDEIAMPVDLRLTLADGTEQWVNIPLGIMQGHKPVPDDWIVAEPWEWTFPEYTLEIETDERVTAAEIDPEGLTPDKNRLDNTASFPLETRFLQPAQQDWFHYSVGWRPLLQYAHDFGFGGGVRAEGTYLFGDHQVEAMLKLWPQVLASGGEEPTLEQADRSMFCSDVPQHLACTPTDVSFFDGIDYAFTYTHTIGAFGPRAEASISAVKHLGLLENRISLTRPLAGPLADVNRVLDIALVHQWNPTDRVFARDTHWGQWRRPTIYAPPIVNPFQRIHQLSAEAAFEFRDGVDILRLTAEVGGSLRNVRGEDGGPGFGNATNVRLQARKALPLGPLTGSASLDLGWGPDDLALHKRFRLGAATLEESWRHNAFRTAAAAFDDPVGDIHLMAFGLAGPVAYTVPHGLVRTIEHSLFKPSGSAMAAASVRLTSGRLIDYPWLSPLRAHAFAGVGNLLETAPRDLIDENEWLADAGLGVSYGVGNLQPLQRWTAQSDVLSGLHLVAKFPLWASHPELIDEDDDALAYRWLVGIQVGD